MANNYNMVWSGPKLDGKLDYNYWEILMCAHLKGHNLWSFIEPGLQEGADATTQRKDLLALSQIQLAIDYSVFGKIANAKTAREAWNILKLSYKGMDKTQKSELQFLNREYERYVCWSKKAFMESDVDISKDEDKWDVDISKDEDEWDEDEWDVDISKDENEWDVEVSLADEDKELVCTTIIDQIGDEDKETRGDNLFNEDIINISLFTNCQPVIDEDMESLNDEEVGQATDAAVIRELSEEFDDEDVEIRGELVIIPTKEPTPSIKEEEVNMKLKSSTDEEKAVVVNDIVILDVIAKDVTKEIIKESIMKKVKEKMDELPKLLQLIAQKVDETKFFDRMVQEKQKNSKRKAKQAKTKFKQNTNTMRKKRQKKVGESSNSNLEAITVDPEIDLERQQIWKLQSTARHGEKKKKGKELKAGVKKLQH